MDSYTTLFAHSAHLYQSLAQLPVLPKQSMFQFRAYDIALPKTIDRESEYLKECQEKQVLPYTKIYVGFDLKQKECVPFMIEQLAFKGMGSGVQEQKSLMKRLLQGGKIHQMELEIDEIKEREMLQHISEQVFSDAAAQKYVLHQGDIWLTQYRMCPDTYGRGTGVSIQSHSPLELKLQLASPLLEREKEMLLSWFEQVKIRN